MKRPRPVVVLSVDESGNGPDEQVSMAIDSRFPRPIECEKCQENLFGLLCHVALPSGFNDDFDASSDDDDNDSLLPDAGETTSAWSTTSDGSILSDDDTAPSLLPDPVDGGAVMADTLPDCREERQKTTPSHSRSSNLLALASYYQQKVQWNGKVYVDSTGHLGVKQEAKDQQMRNAIQAHPLSYGLQQCRWHRSKLAPTRSRAAEAAGVPQLTLTDVGGNEWFLDDLFFYFGDGEDEEDEDGDEDVYD